MTDEFDECRTEPRDTAVRGSRIAGDGLHAVRALAQGTAAAHLPRVPTAVGELGPVNHSCDPNLGWRDDTTLVLTRAVEPGTELTLDYATVLTDPAYLLWCHCETYRCRQVIEGGDWRIPQLQLRYRGYWAPAVAAAITALAG